MKYFNDSRQLVDGPPCEFWDDIEYMPTMDTAWHHWQQPQYDAQRKAWEAKITAPKILLDKFYEIAYI